MNDNDYACMLQFFTERNLFYPAGAQWVSKTIMNPGRDPHSNSVLLPVRFRPAGHLQISGSDTFTTYLSPLHPSTYLILQVFLTDDGTNKRGGHIPTLRNIAPTFIIMRRRLVTSVMRGMRLFLGWVLIACIFSS